MDNCKKQSYELTDAEIYFDSNRDTAFTVDGLPNINNRIFKLPIRLDKVAFKEGLSFENCVFYGSVFLTDCELNQVFFKSSALNSIVLLAGCKLSSLYLTSDTLTQFCLVNCPSTDASIFSNIQILNCVFKKFMPIENLYGIKTGSMKFNALYFSSSEFHYYLIGNHFLYEGAPEFNPSIEFNNLLGSGYHLTNNRLNTSLLFSQCIINKQFTWLNNETNAPLTFHSSSFKPGKIELDFASIYHNPALIVTNAVIQDDSIFNRSLWLNPKLKNYLPDNVLSRFRYEVNGYSLNGYGDKMSANETLLFRHNIDRAYRSLYAQFYTALKQDGQQEDANLCYIQLKDIETQRLKFELADSYTLSNWFAFRLNQFIRFLADYGTNPPKALINSLFVILIFGVLYFLFPSEPDNLSRTRWLPFFSTLQAYITQHVQLPELSRADQARKVQRLQQFKENLETARQDMPPALAWLSLPLYHSATTYYRLQGWLLRRADVLPEAWSQLSPGRKFSKGFLITAYAFLFLFWGLMVRLLNALALSLNAFVTLGYGEIQARGIARYLAVLEGVCGWFLLSIFSVSLITQLMQ